GPNGAGKSTLLRAITGLVNWEKEITRRSAREDVSIEGTISFMGARIDKIPAHKIVKKGLILCPERRRPFREMSVLDNLYAGAYLDKDDSRIQENLESVYQLFPDLKVRSKQISGTLSGGEQQMLAIGMALILKPTLLLLDEPLLGLSPMMQTTLVDAIKNLKKDSGITILITEQFARPIMPFIDRGYVIENGMLALSGTGTELMDNPEVKAAYFGI
ncbi:MAG: ATP-binding cassette domain-containing protein, partial [Desulfobacterales bacterium]|nr:ATP-binding cassette domain-containing protein [Desulfobacterales bacterium]